MKIGAAEIAALARQRSRALGYNGDLNALPKAELAGIIETVAAETQVKTNVVDAIVRGKPTPLFNWHDHNNTVHEGLNPDNGDGSFRGLGGAFLVRGASWSSPLEGTAWAHVGADYKPSAVKTPDEVLDNDRTVNPKGWADPEKMDIDEVRQRFTHANDGKIIYGKDGRPKNPAGPTGKTGRLLGAWGPNHAADPIILRTNPATGEREMLAIKRADTGKWAIPGGMVDAGERVSQALARELEEETGVSLDMSDAVPVYQGVVENDPRNTDEAWMETSVCLKVLDGDAAALADFKPHDADEIKGVRWMPLTDENIGALYADHGAFVKQALAVLDGPPELQGLPRPLKKLALELDKLWGDGDGKLSAQELDRAARYVLSALPFFTEEAGAILELAEALGYSAPSDTLRDLKNNLKDPTLKEGAAERAEFRALFDEAVATSDQDGAKLIRELTQHNPRWHKLSILEHTGAAVAAINALTDRINFDWPEAGAIMLLHDVGKIVSRTEFTDDDGRRAWHFGNHEALGAGWLQAKGLNKDMLFHVKHHGDVRHTARDDILALCGGDQRRLQEFVLIAFADTLAKGDTKDLKTSFSQMEPTLRSLAKHAGLNDDVLVDTYLELRSRWF